MPTGISDKYFLISLFANSFLRSSNLYCFPLFPGEVFWFPVALQPQIRYDSCSGLLFYNGDTLVKGTPRNGLRAVPMSAMQEGGRSGRVCVMPFMLPILTLSASGAIMNEMNQKTAVMNRMEKKSIDKSVLRRELPISVRSWPQIYCR